MMKNDKPPTFKVIQVMVHLNHDACAYSTCIMNTSDILTYTNINILKQHKIKI